MDLRDQNGSERIFDQKGSERIKMAQKKSKWMKMDENESKWILRFFHRAWDQ